MYGIKLDRPQRLAVLLLSLEHPVVNIILFIRMRLGAGNFKS